VADEHRYVKEELIAWRDRWKEVEAAQTEEWRAATVEERFRGLLSLWDFAKSLGTLEPQDPTVPRALWTRLKKDMPIV
jgi:hypothetical protein